MGYKVLGNTEELYQGFGPREGLEGPYLMPNTHRVVYYDPKAGQYYDPRTDWYLEHEEALQLLQNSHFDIVRR